MTKDEFNNLREGDVVQNSFGEGYVIHGVISASAPEGRYYMGVKVRFISDPQNWKLVSRIVAIDDPILDDS